MRMSSLRSLHALGGAVMRQQHVTARRIRLSNRCFSDGPLQVVFLRHGQSTWNQQNIFIGMTDTPLTEDGVLEARAAGRLMAEAKIEIDEVYTSLLRRATKTVWLAMQEMQMEWVPVYKDFRLNERNYGALVGLNKKECVEKHGKEQVRRWRRSWDEPPPPMNRSSVYWPGKDPRYKSLGITDDMIPASESLKQVVERTKPFWQNVIVPRLRARKKVLIVGHENNLRSLIKVLDRIPEDEIIHIDLPRAIPLVYHLDPVTLEPIGSKDKDTKLKGRYLGSKLVLKELHERDLKQVYDLNVRYNMETEPGFLKLRDAIIGQMEPLSSFENKNPVRAASDVYKPYNPEDHGSGGI